jgi:hypothetical protein
LKKLFSQTLNNQLSKRYEDFIQSMEEPVAKQEQIMLDLVRKSKDTVFGKDHHFSQIRQLQHFQENIPIREYGELQPYIDQTLEGKSDVLWPGRIRWFAKSSGTTSAKSKFIPVSDEALQDCHYKAGRELIAAIGHNYPELQIFFGNGLILGGSHKINKLNEHSSIGDLSAILTQNLPFWAKLWQQPSIKTAIIADWEVKIEQMAQEVMNKNITHITGVPTWTIVLINHLLEKSGKDNILELWPNLELYVHGGVNFSPYAESFKKLIPRDNMHYVETYNASEGFFGFQDQKNSKELLLLTKHGIFYEFIPLEELGNEKPACLTLDDIEIGKNYALVISTNGGLWRYLIGDTIRFTSKYPFRFLLSGRTRSFINAFGEELILENAEKAITKACQLCDAEISDYTAAPIYLSDSNKGTHEWIIEFSKKPGNFSEFCRLLDQCLQEVNSDYEAKRFKNIALVEPQINAVEKGTFYRWMKKRGKLGGQNKVPRLFNDRTYIDDIKAFMAIG